MLAGTVWQFSGGGDDDKPAPPGPCVSGMSDVFLTGVAVILDRRVGALARTPISATLSNDVTLGTGLLLISEMAGLKLLVGDNAIFMTTPALSRQFLWERATNPFGLPAFGTPSHDRPRRRIEASP